MSSLTREKILRVLKSAGEPMSVAAISKEIGSKLISNSRCRWVVSKMHEEGILNRRVTISEMGRKKHLFSIALTSTSANKLLHSAFAIARGARL